MKNTGNGLDAIDIGEIKQAFALRLNERLSEIGMDEKLERRIAFVLEQFDISRTAARKWLLGESLPGIEMVITIASRLNISTDRLLGRDLTTAVGVFQQTQKKCHKIDSWVRQRARNGLDGSIELYESDSNTMDPDIRRGDLVFYETEISELEEGEIYLIKHGVTIALRRICIGIVGVNSFITLKGGNNKIENEVFRRDVVKIAFIGKGQEYTEDGINIIGKVIAVVQPH